VPVHGEPEGALRADESPSPVTPRVGGARPRRGLRAVGGVQVVVAVIAVVVVVLAVTTDGFLTTANGKAILLSAAIVGILAAGETLIMIGGSLFSLSLATSSAVCAMAFVRYLSAGIVVAGLIALVVGLLVNGVQGYVVGRYGANPVVVTIAAGGLETGIGAKVTGSHELTPPAHVWGFVGLARPVGGIPVAVFVFLVLAAVLELGLRRTRPGIQLYLLGDSPRAAKAAGLPTAWLTTGAFAVAGLCAGVAGMLLAATNGDASLSLAGNNTYSAITAALVGGTLVLGGSGSVLRTVLGAVGVAAITDLVLLRGYSTGIQTLVEGVLVLGAIVVVQLTRRTGS
jgi:ribose/xylose/arabinose/galactoside ABC-type transport system permease subunit